MNAIRLATVEFALLALYQSFLVLGLPRYLLSCLLVATKSMHYLDIILYTRSQHLRGILGG